MSFPKMGDVSAAVAEPREPLSEPVVELAPCERMRNAVTEHFDFVWRVLRRLGVEPGRVDDAAQEVFIVASRRMAEVLPERDRSYLFAIALRVAAHQRRQQERQCQVCSGESALEIADRTPGPDELLDERRAREVMDAILETIPIEHRAVFVLFEMEEMTMLEISKLLDIPIGTVASRLRRGRQLFLEAVHRRRVRAARTGV